MAMICPLLSHGAAVVCRGRGGHPGRRNGASYQWRDFHGNGHYNRWGRRLPDHEQTLAWKAGAARVHKTSLAAGMLVTDHFPTPFSSASQPTRTLWGEPFVPGTIRDE